MKLIIDIPKDSYERVMNPDKFYRDIDGEKIRWAVYKGTPIPDNATNGDVIKAIFTQWRIIDDADKDMIMFNIPMKVGYEFNACSREWWNSPYQKGGGDDLDIL